MGYYGLKWINCLIFGEIGGKSPFGKGIASLSIRFNDYSKAQGRIGGLENEGHAEHAA